ncbi:unnamed protein product [Caenorhabditis sp. 36 PRJEB53466]|nr:unnamed protein product [Caenorhabditis sp. 36 PRJEB53466]
MSSIVVGSGALAETVVGLLCAAGRRVSLVAPSAKVNAQKFDSAVIKTILQEDSEKKIPFEFIDDLKQQQKLAEKNFKKINVTTDLSKIEAADQIIDACSADESALLTHTAKAVPNATIISLNSDKSPMHSNHVSVKMYSPIRDTKTVKMFANSKASKKAIEEVNQLLDSMGFTVLSEEDSQVADRLVKDMQQVEKSSQLSKLASILVNPLATPVVPTLPKEQYLLF